MAREDLDVARLLRVATAVRRLNDALVMAHDLPELAAIAHFSNAGATIVESASYG